MAPRVISRRPHPRDGAGETFDSATTESEYSSVAPANDAIGWIRRAEAARVQASPRREDRACDARRTMRSLSARDERIKRSKRASIFDGFLSSPIRVFYSILFICALEVRAVDDDDSPAPRWRRPAPRGRSPRSRDRRLTHARPLRGNRRTGFTLVRGLGSRSHVGRLERRGAGVLHARDGAFKSSSFPLVTLSREGSGSRRL